MTLLKNERLPQNGLPLSERAIQLRRTARMKVPPHAHVGDGLDECPWCEEELEPDDAELSTHDNAYECPSCHKLFARTINGMGENETEPRMSRQDRDYLLWLETQGK